MAARAETKITTGPGCERPNAKDRAAIRFALQHPNRSELEVTQLRLDQPLHEGLSSAKVFAATMTLADGREAQVVVKIDDIGRLANELHCANECRDAKIVAAVLAPASTGIPDTDDTRAALIYEHAGSLWDGEMQSLRALTRTALTQDLAARQDVFSKVRTALGGLNLQVYKKARQPQPRSTRLDFYLRRWLSNVKLEINDVERTPHRLFFNKGQDTPKAGLLDLGASDMVEGPEDRPARVASEAIGELVEVPGVTLLRYGSALLGHVSGEGTLQIQATDTTRAAVERELGNDRSGSTRIANVTVIGKLLETRVDAYAQILRKAELDPSQASWTIAGLEFCNPLTHFQRDAWRWSEEPGLTEHVFGHGDLHGGNIMCVDASPMVIDLGLAGSEQPRWADAARLIGSLWRDSIAPQLSREQLAHALELAFRSEEVLDQTAAGLEQRAAFMLRHLFEAALATAQGAARARRELWIDVHHFCWIGLKWSRHGTDELEARRIEAMVLLAAIASEQVSAARTGIVRKRRDDALGELDAMASMLGGRAARGEDVQAALGFSARVHEIIADLPRTQLEEPSARAELLSAHLDRALQEPRWGEGEVSQLERLRRELEHPLDWSEEVLIVDALLFGCTRTWNPQAFWILLELCEAGNEHVELEAYLAVFLLLEHPRASSALQGHAKLRRRLAKMLTRPEARLTLAQLDQMALYGHVVYDDSILNSQQWANFRPTEHAWTLRPFRARDYGAGELSSGGQHEELLLGLEFSPSLSEIEKHMIARSYSTLADEVRRELVEIFANEQRQFSRLGATWLWRRATVRLGSLHQHRKVLALDRTRLEAVARQLTRTLTEVISDEADVLGLARETFQRRLLDSNARGLRDLHDLCMLEPEADEAEFNARLQRAQQSGALEATNGLLRSSHGSSREGEGLPNCIDPGSPRDHFSWALLDWVLSGLLRADVDAEHLGNYAVFMQKVRKDMEAAEELYGKAMEADPSDVRNLGNYAYFMQEVHKDMDAAEELYGKAMEADPNHANNLGNYANFMQKVRKDMEAAEELYGKAMEADPNHARNLGNYAVFMETVRKDMEAAEELYEKAMEADPSYAHALGNYADFMEKVRKNMEAAEELYGKAIEADPCHAYVLSSYAYFMKTVRGDMRAAEALYSRAAKAEPRNPDRWGNLAGILFALGQPERAKAAIARVTELPTPDPVVPLEMRFYEYAHVDDLRAQAADQLEELLAQGVRSPGFDLSANVARAKADGHPDPTRLEFFATQIATEPPASSE